MISGERWGQQWKGRQYTGFIYAHEDTDGYGTFKAKFDDCEEQFDITDLLSHNLISKFEFDHLKFTCLTPEQQQDEEQNSDEEPEHYEEQESDEEQDRDEKQNSDEEQDRDEVKNSDEDPQAVSPSLSQVPN